MNNLQFNVESEALQTITEVEKSTKCSCNEYKQPPANQKSQHITHKILIDSDFIIHTVPSCES